MAATITGTFVLIDRATSTLKKIERQAKKTQTAMEGLGRAEDKHSRTSQTHSRSMQSEERVMKNIERQAKSTSRTLGEFGSSHDKADRSTKNLTSSLGRLGAALGGVSRILMVLKFGGIAVGVTALAQAIGTLAGGAAALVPAMASAAGAIAALPAAVGAAVQGLLTFKLATSGVSEALKAGMTLQKQAGQVAWEASQQHYQAAQQIQQAERSLYLSQRQSRDAQIALTQARRDARRELTDMAFASRDAALAERGAHLSTARARLSLQQTMQTPGASPLDIAEAQLGVKTAQQSEREARVSRSRAAIDNRRTQQRGVGGNRNVISAQRAVADAQYEQVQATKALAQAQKEANHQLQVGTSQQNAYAQALSQLSPAAKTFVQHVVAMRPAFLRLRAAGAEALFPHLTASLDRAKRAMPAVTKIVSATAGTLGQGVEGATKRLTTKGRLGDISAIGAQQNQILSRMLRGLTNVGEGFIDIMRAAAPFTDWLTRTVYGWTKMFEATQKVNRENGTTATKLDHTRVVLQRFGRIASNLWHVLMDVAKAATPLGERLWDGAEKATKGWRNYTDSVGGSRKIQIWFDKLYEPLHALGKLAVDLVKAWARLTVRPEFTKSIQALDKAVPGIEKFMNSMSGMGPGVAKLLSDLATLLGDLPFSPLQTIIGLLDRIIRAVDFLVKKVPGLGNVLSSLLLASALTKSIGLVGKLNTGWGSLFKKWRNAPAPPVGGGGPTVGGGGPRGGGRGTGGGTPAPGGFWRPGSGLDRPAPPASPGTLGRLGKVRGLAGRFGRGAAGPAALAALIGGSVLGAKVGGAGGSALSGAATGAGLGMLLGPEGAAVGALLGGGLGYLTGRHGATAKAQAQGTQDAYGRAVRGTDVTHRRIADLRKALGARTTRHIGATRAGGARDIAGNRLTGDARAKAQAELAALERAAPEVEKQGADSAFGQMQKVYGVYQGGNAAQRRTGRGKMAKLFQDEFKSAGPAGRRALSNSVGQWIETLSKGDKSQRRMSRNMTKAVKDSWGDMGRHVHIVNGQILGGSQKEWGNIRKALKDPVEKAQEDVSKGFTAMQTAAVGSLMSMGYSRGAAKNIIRGMEASGNTTGGPSATVNANTRASASSGINQMTNVTGHAARGTRIPGVGLSDNVMVAPGQMAAPGELIVNRHTEQRVNSKLSRFGTSLGSEVAGETKPHSVSPMGGIMPGLATGGRVGTLGNMIAAANTINAKHYPYSWGGGHNAKFSGPYDCSGSVSAVLHAGGVLNTPVTSGTLAGMYEKGPGEVTIFANPEHTYMRIGQRYFGTSMSNPKGGAGWFDGSARPGFTQRHVPMGGRGSAGQTSFLQALGAANGVGGGSVASITAPTTGVGGIPGSIGNIALAGMAAGLNQRIGGVGGSDAGIGGSYSGGGGLRSWLTQALRITGHYNAANLAGLTRMAMGESSGNPNAIQQIHDINSGNGGANLARGLLQTIPSTFAANKLPGHDDIFNPVDNAIASIRYQYGRYGHIVGHAGYAMGGRMPDWGGWNAKGGSFSVNKPTLFGAGEDGAEDVHITKKGRGASPGINVTIGKIEHHREGDIAAHIKREMEILADDLALFGGD